ncbi:MAG: hypothetical protein ACI9ES_001361 [Oceanospirillaceae bacterium]|jgi:hypothetical protein
MYKDFDPIITIKSNTIVKNIGLAFIDAPPL